MASFSARRYFKNIQKAELLTEYYATHGITALFEIPEDMSRKEVTNIFYDFYKTLNAEKKFDIERELALLDSISLKYTPGIFAALLKKNSLPYEVTQIECETIHDKTLYYYLYHKDLVPDVLFFIDFYKTRGYMPSEAKEVPIVDAEYRAVELRGEFARIANKNDRITECEVKTRALDGLLFVQVSFEGAPYVSPGIDKETGEFDRMRTVRKIEQVHIVYLPEDKEVLIAYTGGRDEKLVFLDAFLRTVCDSGYEEKAESYDLSFCKDLAFDLPQGNTVGLLSWKVKSVVFSFGTEKKKKKLRLSLAGGAQEVGMAPLGTVLRELGIEGRFSSFGIEQVVLGLTFVDREKSDATVAISCSMSPIKSSLCPIFPYDRAVRTLLREAGIYQGFIEVEKKDTQEKQDAGVSDF